MDRRLIPEKSRVSLTKMLGRTGTHGSDPLDRDPVAQIKPLRHSNPGLEFPRRRAGQSSPKFAKMALQGSIRLEFGSGRFGASHVMDLRPQRSSGRL